MAIDSRYRMSQERLDTLKEELHYLETTREKEVAELIKEARSFGDLSENSEYDEAKTEQGKLYSRIAELNDLIENADVVEKVEVAADVVTIGSRVRVLDVDEDVEEEYTIVGSQEANPMECRISDDSPFGKALLGHKVGEGQSGLSGGIVLGLVLGVAQDELRAGVLFRLAAAHSAQRRTGGQRQHTAAGNHPPAHSPASGSAFAF